DEVVGDGAAAERRQSTRARSGAFMSEPFGTERRADVEWTSVADGPLASHSDRTSAGFAHTKRDVSPHVRACGGACRTGTLAASGFVRRRAVHVAPAFAGECRAGGARFVRAPEVPHVSPHPRRVVAIARRRGVVRRRLLLVARGPGGRLRRGLPDRHGRLD